MVPFCRASSLLVLISPNSAPSPFTPTTAAPPLQFEMGTDSRPKKGSKKPPKDKPIDLNLDDGGCLSCECCSEVSTLKMGATALAVMLVAAGAIVAVLLLLR